MPRMLLVFVLACSPALAQPSGKPTTPQAPAAQDRNILLRNNSESVLRELYLWNGPSRETGPDRLGADVVRPGATFALRLGRGPCQVEMRAVFEDGSAEARSGVEVCATRELVVDDRNTRAVEVVNNTDVELMQLFLARPGVVGPDRLGAATVPGSDSFNLRLRGETECRFEARAVFRGAQAETRQQVDLCATPRIVFGDPSIPLREVTIANRTRRVLRELYATTGDSWGGDRLGATVLNPGQSFLLRIRNPACRVRLRAVFADNQAEERSDVDICNGQTIAFAPGRQVALVHAHGRPVREVYLSSVQESDWGENQLGDRPLARGERREIATDSACEADLRIVFDNGNAEEARNINICTRAEITLRPGWVLE
ncbi:hypothetical protein KTR66_19190 [Roseococcus sp. SDR]|uniref:hypothetical protein n=1 Tax=Roseococcus sp. SDR TaxID=2835532 RepID=UPI001BCB8D85|nr:hypothetical protein [Roseococcus sp. SDR]MBS7792134.1 hypothetical protein [Roseococcus sp. SDR]MBV1847448.1 hypothetical protein [Roseococcus sp. SDR]